MINMKNSLSTLKTVVMKFKKPYSWYLVLELTDPISSGLYGYKTEEYI